MRAGGFLHVRGRIAAVALIVSSALLLGCSAAADLRAPEASTEEAGGRAAQARVTLQQLVEAIDQRSRAEAVALAAPNADRLLGEVYDNAHVLGIGGLSIRFLDEGAALTKAERADLGPGAWRGTVQLEYAYSGLDPTPVRMETSVVFVTAEGGTRIDSFGGAGKRSPLWLARRLSVDRTPRSLVAVAGRSQERYAGVVSRALAQVRRVLPQWRGSLVVEVPQDRVQLEAVLLAASGQYDNIAAVTTTADGSLSLDAPVRVVLNPGVFDQLGKRGAQVVLSHEATHVATGATFTSMATWLLEGFADFVALEGVGVPVDVAAGQVLDRVRRKGLPQRLPTSAALDPSASGLGATYEEAWLACRFLAQKFGTERLVRFYRTVAGGASTHQAFKSELDITQEDFVARWRSDLARLAGVAR